MEKSEEKTSIKLVVVGDGSVGKTCVLLSYTKDECPTEYVPTVFETYTAKLNVDKKMVSLTLVDTAGQEEYSNLRGLAYPGTDIFMILFSVVDPASFDNAINVWFKELSQRNPPIPIMFVGNKIDLREKKMQDPNIANNPKLAPIQTHIAQKTISALGQQCKYMETSAVTQENLKNVFDQAIIEVLKKRGKKPEKEKKKQKKGICNIY